MKFLGQGFQTLEHEQDRHTDRQTRPNALPAAFVHTILALNWSVSVQISLNFYFIVINTKVEFVGRLARKTIEASVA